MYLFNHLKIREFQGHGSKSRSREFLMFSVCVGGYPRTVLITVISLEQDLMILFNSENHVVNNSAIQWLFAAADVCEVDACVGSVCCRSGRSLSNVHSANWNWLHGRRTTDPLLQ